jgi:predicted transcriptional regulator
LLKQFFSGSADELVQHLLDEEEITPEQLHRLREAYDHARRKEDDE